MYSCNGTGPISTSQVLQENLIGHDIETQWLTECTFAAQSHSRKTRRREFRAGYREGAYGLSTSYYHQSNTLSNMIQNRLKILHGGTLACMVDLGGSLAVASKGLFQTGVSTDLSGEM